MVGNDCASSDSPEKSRYPPRSSLMGTNGSTPETRRKLKKHADCDLLHRVGSYNLTTSKNKQPPAFQSLANIQINYSTTVVVSTVAGFQPSTLLHVPSCFFQFCDICVLDPATIWPFEFVGFFTFHTPSFRSELLDFQKISPKLTCLHPCGRTTAKQDLA